MPDAEKFWDKTAQRYAKSPVKNMAAYETTLERTRAYLSADDDVLELGCGTGTTALLLAAGVKHVTATDISSNMIGIGRDKAKDQQVDNVDFVHATLDDGALDGRSFDAILAFNLLHLLPELPAALGRIHGLLKPGGVFISKSVCLGEKCWLWRPVVGAARLVGVAPYVNVMRIAELEASIVDAGFEIVETGLYPPSPPSRFVVARKPAA